VDQIARSQLIHHKDEFQRDCQLMLSPSGWDVSILVGTYQDGYPYNAAFHDLKGCGNLPRCAGTVEVDGKCYYAHQVNYVLFGFLGSWCGHSRWLLERLVREYKELAGRPWEADDAVAWMNTGFHDVNRYCWVWGKSTFDQNCEA
jgi:hypothetical protein